jgi:CxxC motif-containing protein (DUF1111 family)
MMRGLGAVVLTLLAFEGCRPQGEAGRQPGEPLDGLTEAQLGRFLLGRAVFERLTTPEEGLGPLYNAERCSACHSQPTSGGSGPALVVKATRFEGGRCDLLIEAGGDNLQQRATRLLQAHGITREAVPTGAATARLTGPPLFGLGLVEGIPEEAILTREDSADADGDGISGRAPRTADGRLARFGRKGDAVSIPDFTDAALRFELGLTTTRHPQEEAPNGRPLPPSTDPMVDPEIDERGLALLADYVGLLAPPAQARTPAAERDSVRRGARIFESVGCASCHIPEFRSGASEVRALNRKPARLYSDLLLHDLGSELAGVCGPRASPSEYRTAPLWGLRFRTAHLHDGRAKTVPDAIALHGGEAAAARDRFARLPTERRRLLLRFLASL